MTGSVTFDVAIGGDGSTVTDDDNATTGLRDGGWRTRFVPCFTNQVSIANYVVTKANEASTSASAASSSATAAAAAYDSFDDRYLGAKSSNPTVDNDGNALLTGALYWNTPSSEMRVYSGSAWITSYLPASGYLALSGGTMTGAITFAAGQFGTNVNTFLTTPSSANLKAALTDETGSGAAVFADTPTLIAPILGTPTSGTLTNCTFPTLNQSTTGTAANVTGIVAVANGGTGTTTPDLVAGTNITISGTWPNQTINASGGASLTGITGATNTALGVSALNGTLTGTYNTALGVNSLNAATTALENVAVGYDALGTNTSANYCVAIGSGAIRGLPSTGSSTIAIGFQSLYSATSLGQNNIAIGSTSMRNATGTSVADNIALGYEALRATTGARNIAIGSNSLQLLTTGTENVAIGHRAQLSATTGSGNSAMGAYALFSNTTGASNAAVGNGALYSNTTGAANVAMGEYALYYNTTGSENSAFGATALYSNTTGASNAADGTSALYSNTTGYNNSAMGYQALTFNTTGFQNSAMGYYALRNNNTGNRNSAVGNNALNQNTTGTYNSAVGIYALENNTTGGNNSAVGQSALNSNTTGSYNVGIGASCAASSATVSNEVNIYNGTVAARFQGSASSWSFVSDSRDKTNIVDLELGLDFINKLQPRKFEWDLRHTDVDKGKAASGFIAQEVLSVLEQEDALFTGIVDTNDSEKYMLAQTNLIPILVNAIKELSAELTALKLKVGI